MITHIIKSISLFTILALNFSPSHSILFAQDTANPDGQKFRFSVETLKLNVGDVVDVKIELLDKDDKILDIPFIVYGSGRRAARTALEVTPRRSESGGVLEAKVKAHKPGTFKLRARTASVEGRYQQEIDVEIAFPPITKIAFENPKNQMYAGTTIAFTAHAVDATDTKRKDAEISFSVDNANIASLDPFGNVRAQKPGTFTLTARTGNISENVRVRIVENPVVGLKLESNVFEARTGDVIPFRATAHDNGGQSVVDAPVNYSVTGKPLEEKPEASAIGEIGSDGRFVAETPGFYTIIAQSGPYAERITIKISQRNVQKDIEVVGHGAVTDVYTSDLWVWEGVDGKDYVVTGTWGSNGEAYFWDASDPANLTIIDKIKVDARTVNDVKVSEDGRIAVISREGASNRRNGLVVLDVSNPRDVKILSEFDEELTGGVHNVFIYDDHVYAINNGTRYDIINIADPTKPYRVSRFELDAPGHSVHDVWIEDGIAYSSNWAYGLQLVDVGGLTKGVPFSDIFKENNPELAGITSAGGSPKNPVQFGSYTYPSGANHAAFPFHSRSTGKFYVIAGDESFPYGLGVREDIPRPTIADGWLHFVDFTDLKNPEETAFYRVPEAGSHNFWVDGDILYAAFYNGGFRVIDISGDLKGDLYKQGREIAKFVPLHHEGIIPNAAMVWGPMPHKGLIYFSDHNSGLWAVKLVDKKNSN